MSVFTASVLRGCTMYTYEETVFKNIFFMFVKNTLRECLSRYISSYEVHSSVQ